LFAKATEEAAEKRVARAKGNGEDNSQLQRQATFLSQHYE
jgi:hypothetical protein